MSKKFALSFSGGKDSVLSLHRLVKQGWEPACLLTSYNQTQHRSWFHGIPERMLQEMAESLKIPLCLIKIGENDDYNQAFEQTLKMLKARDINACAFGDIDLPAHREWDEGRCRTVGMEALLPLWEEDRATVVTEFITSGYRAIVKNVRLAELDETFLGRTLSQPLLEDIRNTGADVCGENGEYHTVVVNGSLFHQPVELRAAGIVRTPTHAFLDLY